MDNQFIDWFIDLQGDQLTIYKHTDVWNLMEKHSLVFRERGDLESISFDLNIKGIQKDISQVILNSRENKARTQEEVEFIHFYNLVEGHELEFVISLAKRNQINFSKLPKILSFYNYEVFKHYFMYQQNQSDDLFVNCLYFLSLVEESQGYVDFFKSLISRHKCEILKVIVQLLTIQENNKTFITKHKYYYLFETIDKKEDEKRDQEILIHNYYQVKKFLKNYKKGQLYFKETNKYRRCPLNFQQIFEDVTDYKYFWVLFDIFQIEKNYKQYECNQLLIEATYNCRIDFSDKLLECWGNTMREASTTSECENVIKLFSIIIKHDPDPIKCLNYCKDGFIHDLQELLYFELPKEIVVIILQEKDYDLYIESERRGSKYLKRYSQNVMNNLTKDNYEKFAKRTNLQCFLVMYDFCKNSQASIDLCKQYLNDKVFTDEENEDNYQIQEYIDECLTLYEAFLEINNINNDSENDSENDESENENEVEVKVEDEDKVEVRI